MLCDSLDVLWASKRNSTVCVQRLSRKDGEAPPKFSDLILESASTVVLLSTEFALFIDYRNTFRRLKTTLSLPTPMAISCVNVNTL